MKFSCFCFQDGIGHRVRAMVVCIVGVVGWGMLGADLGAQVAPEVRIAAVVGHPGTVEVLPPGGRTWILTQTNQVLGPGYQLRTGPNTRVMLRWSDQSVVTFGPLTEAEILAPHGSGTEPGVHLLQGLLSFFHRERPGRIRVLSRGTTAGVKGTEFVVVATDAGAGPSIYVIDGSVGLTNAAGTLTLTNGQHAVVPAGQAPQLQTAGFIANNVLQWCLYYPAVLDLRDVPFTPTERDALGESLAAYSAGDLPAALALYPEGRPPASDAERIYRAAVLLAIGRVAETEATLAAVEGVTATDSTNRVPRLASALRMVIAAVKRSPAPAAPPPELASEFLAASYYEQSLATGDSALRSALELAKEAVSRSADFGFGWARVAELEFSFGRIRPAMQAARTAQEKAPRNAQMLAVMGFLVAGQNKTREAIDWFNRALSVDRALGNGWLGRGLCRIRSGDRLGGHEDLLLAAAMEPQRSLLRSYLGKSDSGLRDAERARHGFELAKRLDRNDPTPWLYSALELERLHRLNQAIDELEESKALNDNRLLYRSRLLLDQDRGVRSANLARIYDEAGLPEVAIREAARSVTDDYGNYSAHLFLANSFNALRRANRVDLRYETAAFSEYLLANLLGPADGSLLAQPVSQQEYTRLFAQDNLGFSSSTEYLSRGAWTELAVQHGTFGNSSYAVEVDYLKDPGQVSNSAFEQKVGSVSFKQMVTPQDGIYLEALFFSQFSEDIGIKYDPRNTVDGLRTREDQIPALLLGLDHQWNERQRTLALAGHVQDTLRQRNPFGSTYLVQEIFGNPIGFTATDLTHVYESDVRVESIELQHIARGVSWQTIAGIRYQENVQDVSSTQSLQVDNASSYELYFSPVPGVTITNQSFNLNTRRLSPYLYQHWQPFERLWLIGGVSYDYQEQPRNVTSAPFSVRTSTEDQLSPKAALVWTPSGNSAVRGALARSLGGNSLGESVRIEPSQLGGFLQSYRDVIPASLGYSGIPGSQVDTANLSLEHRLPSRTYLAVSGQLLRSEVDHDVGVWERELSTSTGPGLQTTERLRFQERSLGVSVHQLLEDWFSFGLRYHVSEARLKSSLPELDPSLAGGFGARSQGVLHNLSAQALARHSSGIFAGVEGLWWSQQLSGDLASLREDEVWQANVFVGYRSPRRRFEITLGLLNATDQDYRLHPINFYSEIPRERTYFTRVVFSF